MSADRLVQAVRQQLGLGRLVPLGGAGDGAWVTEQAACGALRRAAAHALPGARLDALRLDLADPERTEEPAVPPPPSALPPGPLLLAAELALALDTPLPEVTSALRELLLTTAEAELGLSVAAVDLRVTDLLEDAGDAGDTGDAEDAEDAAGVTGADRAEPADEDGGAVGRAVLAVPGVARLAPALGVPPARGVRMSDGGEDGGPPHVSVQLAVRPGHRALDVAREAGAAAREAASGTPPPTVAVLVTAIDPGSPAS
ncbi:hypothetical protein [Streptomyces boncukensis]|uniref:Nucleopolyhedrovirus P10 family protein n=1 Tax=Streptomyces boncukensis TaxID=2711219 RepID=A0A6G4WUQ1_9ACTN|nr:hypothetical protein [Streptomyces boncukensis]NGO69019.1 hypothetical protein [Streptomyces boncukensis]